MNTIRFDRLVLVAKAALLDRRNPIVAIMIVMLPMGWTASNNDLRDVVAYAMAQLRKGN